MLLQFNHYLFVFNSSGASISSDFIYDVRCLCSRAIAMFLCVA